MPTIEKLREWLEAERLPDVVVTSPTHGQVAVSRFLRRERRSSQAIERTPSCWAPNKPALSFDGGVTWAEFVIVRLLQKAGWDARWIKNWAGGREPCVAVGRKEALPKGVMQVFQRINQRAAIGSSGGPWDVFAWRDDQFLCIESKQHKSNDKLRETQLRWMDAALNEGITDFAIVEYHAPKLADAGGASPPTVTARGQEARSIRRSQVERRTGRSGVLGSEYATDAPLGQGCEWLTRAGSPCQNPANYCVEGKWSCSRDHRP